MCNAKPPTVWPHSLKFGVEVHFTTGCGHVMYLEMTRKRMKVAVSHEFVVLALLKVCSNGRAAVSVSCDTYLCTTYVRCC